MEKLTAVSSLCVGFFFPSCASADLKVPLQLHHTCPDSGGKGTSYRWRPPASPAGRNAEMQAGHEFRLSWKLQTAQEVPRNSLGGQEAGLSRFQTRFPSAS